MSDLLTYITNFADEAVILPVWLTLTVGLYLTGWRRGATAWLLVVGSVMLVVLITKSMVAELGPVGDIYSPSGHTSMAPVLAGGSWTLLARPVSLKLRLIGALTTAFAVAVVIGLSRVLLGDHTTADVLVVVPLGMAGAGLVTWLAASPPAGLRTWPVAVAAVAIMALFHGDHLSAEHTIAKAFGNGARRAAVIGSAKTEAAFLARGAASKPAVSMSWV